MPLAIAVLAVLGLAGPAPAAEVRGHEPPAPVVDVVVDVVVDAVVDVAVDAASVVGDEGTSDDPPTTVVATTVPPESTFNEFFPEDRSLGDCLGALERPGCGSESRGGWRQGLVFGALVAGLGFIAWRVIRVARRAAP